ncbi:hypothetical protein HIM_06437 [Hirsutella minnesotensis 3608]|uniref:Uncharacterized protein n=1 Tax=Hirsutella minnesotensis 3608 TaxID=1043627 RepID=A0A0F7ZJ84_9HYPO|nr:hypothetical protein HIM_06437 [Hirsutella minnesotensis 3608]
MTERPRRVDPGAQRPRGPVAAAVRANLFRGQLTRRPTASSSTSAETVRLDVDVLSDSSEIVVRNQQGEIELGDPPTPTVDEHDEQAEDRQETERERQRLAEAVKRHAMVSHSSVPDQPEGKGLPKPQRKEATVLTRKKELLEAVRADLRAKVNALADDNWMFEPEEQTRG